MSVLMSILFLVIGMGLGAALWGMFKTLRTKEQLEEANKTIATAKTKSEEIIKEAEIKKQEIILDGKKETEKQKSALFNEFKQREKRLNKREEQLDKRDEILLSKDAELKKIEKKQTEAEKMIEKKKEELENKEKEISTELERISKMTQEEAKEMLINQIEDEAKHLAAKQLKAIEENLNEDREKLASKIVGTAIQRYAGEYVVENTVTTISLPNDEMKGRIIGREGRNIRSIEAVTGVDLIIDDTPEAITISDFNPVRREIAAITVRKLVADGRIHPGRIEEIFDIATKEVWKNIKEAGEQALFDLGIHKLHPELVLLIGRLRYRTSYGQNVWRHSIETGFFAGLIAAELGLNTKLYRRAGLLHDIGKAVDHEVEGSHAVIGAKLAEKYGESKKIVHAIMAHHNDEKPETVMDFVIQAADALSGARPGARREMTDLYIQRLADLEKIATDFDGVDKAFAIQAGRELRVMVDTSKVSDETAYILANNISKKVEEDLTYPGQIKVIVIREKRVISVAQ